MESVSVTPELKAKAGLLATAIGCTYQHALGSLICLKWIVSDLSAPDAEELALFLTENEIQNVFAVASGGHVQLPIATMEALNFVERDASGYRLQL